jgi:hypothetical protein
MLYEEGAGPSGSSFGGSVIWRTDRVPPGPGQKPEIAVRADIEIPEQKMAIGLLLWRNDESLPASHTMKIMFSLPPDFSHGGISRIPAVLMKQAEAAPGIPLAGLGVKVTPNIFLISLSSAEADAQRNVQLLKERPWLDIPIIYDDGKRALIAIGKGASGERAFAEAFAGWADPIEGARLPQPPMTVTTVRIPEGDQNDFRWRKFAPRAVEPPPSVRRVTMVRIPEGDRVDAIALLPESKREPQAPLIGATLRQWPAQRVPQWARSPQGWQPWAWTPGWQPPSWAWQLGWSPETPTPIKTASITIASSTTLSPKSPPWLLDVSRMTTVAISAAPWSPLPRPDLRIPTGRSRFAHEANLEPPTQFVRWSDRVEEVLPEVADVDRRCRAIGVKVPPGKVSRGCAYNAAGRCFIVRVDDPGVARHELAHCNGWKHS